MEQKILMIELKLLKKNPAQMEYWDNYRAQLGATIAELAANKIALVELKASFQAHKESSSSSSAYLFTPLFSCISGFKRWFASAQSTEPTQTAEGGSYKPS